MRALLAYKRGEPRVCAMLRVPTPRKKTAVSRASARRVRARSSGATSIASSAASTWRVEVRAEQGKLNYVGPHRSHIEAQSLLNCARLIAASPQDTRPTYRLRQPIHYTRVGGSAVPLMK